MTETEGTVKVTEGHEPPSKAKNQVTQWETIDWGKAEKRVRHLRRRIFRATQQKDWKRVRDLTRLMLKSYSNIVISVRRVSQINAGKNTPGVDGQTAKTSEERGKLVDQMKSYEPWKATPTRRVYIKKNNGKQRPLGIPTIRDRAMQAVVKNAIEPRFEAEFEAKSYGFRPGRSCQDAIEEVFRGLSNGVAGRNEYILDADIKGAFDHLSHEFILNRVGKIPGNDLIKQWLKAGYIEWGKLYETEEGTPQGGVSARRSA
jgi:RNA-directed DNA polymerase